MIHTILKNYWGFDDFRPLQEDIINSILQKKDTLALLPTGGGKSICFQVPALHLEGICIVVSPLIALMKDQVENLQSKGIKAVALYSGMTKDAIDRTLDNCIYGDTKFLYLSPERLQTDIFLARFQLMNVSFIAVDEAHCISQWGYDFRPAYLKIADLRALKPHIPILALTATATLDVVKDIQQKLLFETENVFQKSFSRANLSYSVLYEDAKRSKLIDILQKVKGSTLIYVQNRKQTKEIAELVQQHNISASFYHAGLSADERDARQSQWINDEIRVIVATNAFGMGIDKPDVRLVVHITVPESIEAYFQEAGRAGRDGKKAFAVLLVNDTDTLKTENVLQHTMPSITEIKDVYDALGNYFQLAVGAGKNQAFPFDLVEFCNVKKLPFLKTIHALKFLESDGYLNLTESVYQDAKLYIKCSKEVFQQFIETHQEYESILKLLLRSYGGLFDAYTKIKEKHLAQKLEISIAETIKLLKQLETLGIIAYEPKNELPFIFYLEVRLERRDLLLNQENILKRTAVFEEKHQKMLSYTLTKNKCRSVMLLDYFGEKNASKCGICDVCLGRNELHITTIELKKAINNIKPILIENEYAIDDLKALLKPKNQEKWYRVVKHLITEEWIMRNEKGMLFWNLNKK